MSNKRIAEQHHASFESIRQQDAEGNEYWLARQLAVVLDYSQYRHFLPVIGRAKEKLKREKVRGKQRANQTHFEVGQKVRQTIKDLGGTMPEFCRHQNRASSKSKARRKSWKRKNEVLPQHVLIRRQLYLHCAFS
jgi:hypothetical protein